MTTTKSRDKKQSPERLWEVWRAFDQFEEHGRRDDLLRLELYSDGSGAIVDSDNSGAAVTVVSWSTLAEAPDVIREADKTFNGAPGEEPPR